MSLGCERSWQDTPSSEPQFLSEGCCPQMNISACQPPVTKSRSETWPRVRRRKSFLVSAVGVVTLMATFSPVLRDLPLLTTAKPFTRWTAFVSFQRRWKVKAISRVSNAPPTPTVSPISKSSSSCWTETASTNEAGAVLTTLRLVARSHPAPRQVRPAHSVLLTVGIHSSW